MEKKSKKKKGNNKIIILGVVIIVLIIVAIIVILLHPEKNINKNKQYYEPETRYERASSTIIEGTQTKGWITVQGTNIDYPVVLEMETNNNVKEYAWVSNDYYDGETRMAIYGHNIRNVSSNPIITDSNHSRFEQLLSFVYEDFAKENLYIQYSHDDVDELYKIYAIGFYDNDYGLSYSYTTQKEKINQYIDTVRNNSIYDYDVDVNDSDMLLSLITCTRFFGVNDLTTFKIDARKVRNEEKIEKYSVQSNKNYDILDLE